jgi:hypothetical protein
VFISSGGFVYEAEEEVEAFGHEFVERASVWRPFTTEHYELNKPEEGRSILREAYMRWQEQEWSKAPSQCGPGLSGTPALRFPPPRCPNHFPDLTPATRA